MSRQRNVRPKSSIAPMGNPAANAPPTIEPAEVPAIQSIRMLFSTNARKTPTWAIPRAAPPDSASPILGYTEVSDSIQHHDLRTLTSCVKKRVRLRFNLCLHQRPFDLVAALLQHWNDSSRGTRLKARYVSVTVVIGNLLLADYYEISEAKVQIFFHLETLLDYFVQFFT